MTSPFTNNPSWNNQNNATGYNQPLQRHNQQLYGAHQVNPNQQPYGEMPAQQMYHQQQQQQPVQQPNTYWNNNKPQVQPTNTWPQQQQQQQQYVPVQQMYPQQQQPQPQPMMTQVNHQSSSDPWSWGWDDSSNNSPQPSNNANTITNNNDTSWNWDVEDGDSEPLSTAQPNSVSSYFVSRPRQINIPNNTTTSLPTVEVNSPATTHEPKVEVVEESGAALTVENAAEINLHSSDVYDQKSESVHSYQSRGSGAKSETNNDRLSPDVGKIPLTTQALREFHKEIYENGPVDLKSRHNTDGLTPQWSIESQMSQETVSDDISPSVQGGSQSDVDNRPHSDIDTRPSTVSQSPLSNQQGGGSFEQNWYEYQQPIMENTQDEAEVYPTQATNNELGQNRMFVSVRTDLYETQVLTSTLDNLTLDNQVGGEDVENKEIITPEQQQQQPPLRVEPPPIKLIPNVPTTKSEHNPFSNRRPLNHRYATQRTQDSGTYRNVQVYQNIPQDFKQQTAYEPLPRTDHENVDEPESMKPRVAEDCVNLESVPENKERPDVLENRNVARVVPVASVDSGSSWSTAHWKQGYNVSPENQEVAPRCGPDRNQYLETGRLEEVQELSGGEVESLPPPGLSRLVTGEGQQQPPQSDLPNLSHDISTPPPGLDRMVPGQLQENDRPGLDNLAGPTPPPGLHRMVVGRTTHDTIQQLALDSNMDLTNTNTVVDDAPPPGLHRMIPGESSSPETQNMPNSTQSGGVFQPIDTRVVTGVANDDNTMQSPSPLAASSPVPIVRLPNQNNSGEDDEPTSRLQPQSERCETIGSDNVEAYNPVISPSDDNSMKMSKRKERKDHERDRDCDRDRLHEDVSSDERDRDAGGGGGAGGGSGAGVSGRQRDTRDSGDYYRDRDRNRGRDYSPDRGGGSKDRRSKGDRRKESPGRYKEKRRDYRDDRRRHRDYDYSDDEVEGSGYYSDRDRRSYRDDYDRSYSRRDERARTLDRPDKSSRDTRDMRGKERRRGYERDVRHSDYYSRRRAGGGSGAGGGNGGGGGAGHDDVDDYREEQRSRPASRNGSVHDFKQRYSSRGDYDHERDRDHYSSRGHSKRDREAAYYQGYNYDPAYFNYYYQYYDNLRRTNPAAYAEICRKYYANSQPGTFEGTYTEDRASVHSGRSSANEDTKDRGMDTSSQFEDMGTSAQRLTPAKFTTAHVKGVMTGHGQLLKIVAHYPLDGQPATVEIHEQILCLEETRRELQDFPGPLVKGVTHKNNVLRYCKQKIKDADTNTKIYDKDSYKLIWELLILLIRQNGTVVGTDIAELLMSNRSLHVTPSPATSHHSINEQNTSQPSEEEVTNQFRDFLIYGNSKEALEWAMKQGLWGHALFLASKMDQRTYASVMTRFANGLTINDPLQTLYQLMSGRQPAAVTCLSDEKWGDWRPHLAMILSNASSRPDLDHKAITTLGDTLGARGSLYASHFCYLMAQVEFGSYSHKSSKLVLIGSSHNQPFAKFSTNEAIFATEIFEFACNLADSEFSLHHLQVYKLLIARRLLEASMPQEALHYVEVIANTIAKQPAQYTPSFIQEVYDLGNRLKYYDPLFNSEGTEDGVVNNEPNWLSQLMAILNDYQMGVLQHDGYGSVSNLTYSETDQVTNQEQSLMYDPSQQWHQQLQQRQQPSPWMNEDRISYQETVDGVNSNQQMLEQTDGKQQAQQQYWQNQWNIPQQQPVLDQTHGIVSPGSDYNTTTNDQQQQLQTSYNYFENQRNEDMSVTRGNITLPNSAPQQPMQQSSASAAQLARQPSREDEKKRQQAKQQQQQAKKDTPKINQTSGWFGGLWNKLALRPKNQMKLPDDKDPSIVWDPDKKRWVDLDAGDDETNGGLAPPPPKVSDLMNHHQVAPAPPGVPPAPAPTQTPGVAPLPGVPVADANHIPPPAAGPNIYKMAKGKSLRSNYVNVLNPRGNSATPSNVPPPDLFPGLAPTPPAANNYFVPAPVEGLENAPTDFLTPAPVRTDFSDPQQQQAPAQALSRWSSTSSLSREVQKYTVFRGRSRQGEEYGVNSYPSRPHSRSGLIINNKPPVPTFTKKFSAQY